MENYYETPLWEDEIWRTIPSFPDWKISSLGRVFSIKKNKYIGTNAGNGYMMVRTTHSGEYIHRLVAMAFPEICGEYKDGLEVDHLNTIKTDNRALNLRWVTRCENRNNPISAKHFSDARKGIPAWNKGIPLTEECKMKKSLAIKGRHWKLVDGVRVWS